MNFNLSVLLVVAASGCVETPATTRLPSSKDVSLDAVQLKDQPARYAVDVDSLIPCPLDAVMQMLPDPMVQQHLTHASRTHGGATAVSVHNSQVTQAGIVELITSGMAIERRWHVNTQPRGKKSLLTAP